MIISCNIDWTTHSLLHKLAQILLFDSLVGPRT